MNQECLLVIAKKPHLKINRLCQHNAHMIHKNSVQNSDIHFEAFLFSNTTHDQDYEIQTIETNHHIRESGVWTNIIHSCIDPEFAANADDLKLSASQTTVNPLGFAGGEYLISFPILVSLIIIYMILSLLWSYWMLPYHEQIIPFIHWFIYIGINIALIETAFHFYHYIEYNNTGKQCSMIVMFDFILSLILSVYARWVMVLISTGHGIVFPNLNKKVIGFLISHSLSYMIALIMLRKNQMHLIIDGVSDTAHYNQKWIVSLAVLDVMIIGYIYLNLADVLDELMDYKQRFKLDIYKLLTYVLGAMIVLGTVGIILQTWLYQQQLFIDPAYWVICCFLKDGLWRIISLILALTVIYIWKPHQNSLKYLYSEEIYSDESDECISEVDITPIVPEIRNV